MKETPKKLLYFGDQINLITNQTWYHDCIAIWKTIVYLPIRYLFIELLLKLYLLNDSRVISLLNIFYLTKWHLLDSTQKSLPSFKDHWKIPITESDGSKVFRVKALLYKLQVTKTGTIWRQLGYLFIYTSLILDIHTLDNLVEILEPDTLVAA